MDGTRAYYTFAVREPEERTVREIVKDITYKSPTPGWTLPREQPDPPKRIVQGNIVAVPSHRADPVPSLEESRAKAAKAALIEAADKRPRSN